MASLQVPQDNVALSSSPAFGTPVYPVLTGNATRPPPPPPAFKPVISTILPTRLPRRELQILAVRTFQKHNLTLSATAIQPLATFIGKYCGSTWLTEGTGQKVLDEVAQTWEKKKYPAIVEDGDLLQEMLHILQGCMSGGKISSLVNISQGEEQYAGATDPRDWLKVISAFEQPRLSYDTDKKHFNATSSKPSFHPPPSYKTALYRDRFHVIHQRLQRNPAFQAPLFDAVRSNTLKRQASNMTDQQSYKITQIAHLLGRGGSSHLLLGMLAIAPTGTLALNDLTGSISVDLQHAKSMQGGDAEPYYCPGMIVLVDGVYEEDWAGAGSSGLGNVGGVGGTIGGRFLGFQIGGPPVEKRQASLGEFGWTDFLGLGSEREVGQQMRDLEQRLLGPDAETTAGRKKMVILSEVVLDQPLTLIALRKIFQGYTDEPPLSFVLCGNFSSKATMAGSGTGSIEYKELFNELAAILADFPTLLSKCTFVFVPGDNDPWTSSFSTGASALIPQKSVPDLFTSRIKRAFANAKSDNGRPAKDATEGEAIWTSNPTRISVFGPAHEMVVFRDDSSGRLRRNAVLIGQATKEAAVTAPQQTYGNEIVMSGALPTTEDIAVQDTQTAEAMMLDESPVTGAQDSFATVSAKRVVLSLLPQSTLSPFPLNIRPTDWNYPSALSLYPLPHTLVLADPEAPPFALTFEGCHIINPGRLVEGGSKRKKIQWIEYDSWAKKGALKESWVG